MLLSDITLSGPQRNAELLYYRLLNGRFDKDSGWMSRGTVLELDTYFNSFSASIFARYTRLDVVHVSLDADRALKITLFDGATPIKTVSGTAVSFSIRACTQRVSLRLEAETDCVFRGGCYWTDERPNDGLRLSIVTCTYRREAYIQRTLDSLTPLLDERVQFFLIDNAGTISDAISDSPFVHLVKNPNLGGSGGFSRGMYETLHATAHFTHILLMDDDVVLDRVCIQRLLALLAFLRPEHGDIQVAGGMLATDRPTVQIENTGRWEGRNAPNKAELDLSAKQALVENEREVRADYGAWWFLCLPVKSVRMTGLALPLFFKCDDAEYGIRLKAHIVTMNGVGLWHEPFTSKFDRITDYYITRNTLILNAIAAGRNGTPTALKLYALRCYQTVVLKDRKLLDYVRLGLSDYLRGPDYLENLSADTYHQKLKEDNARVDFRELSGSAKLKALLPRVCTVDFLRATGVFLSGALRLAVRNSMVSRLWRSIRGSLSSEEYWRKRFDQSY